MISGTLEDDKSTQGKTAGIIMPAINDGIEASFVQALQLDVLTLKLEFD